MTTHLLRTEDGQPQGWVLTFVDQTPHVLAREEGALALARYRTLVHAFSDGVLVVDRDGRVLDANPAARELLEGPTPAHLWDLAAARATVFQIKGALADLTPRHGSTHPHPVHEFSLRLKDGRALGIALRAVEVPGEPPIVVLGRHPEG